MRQLGLDEILPEESGSSFPWDYKQERPPQDQYAIVTPEGRFEVEELSERGLYRSRYPEYYAYEPAEYEPAELDAQYAEYVAEAQPEPVGIAEIAPQDEVAIETAPQVAEGGPRIVYFPAEPAALR